MNAATAIATVAAWEGVWWLHRKAARDQLHQQAVACATALGRPLVVVGAPDLGATGSPDGDIVIDIRPSALPHALQADVCQPLPFAPDSVVVFVSCVFEYVDDLAAAVAELTRISGGYLFVVTVEPWTLTSFLYPGTRRRIPYQLLPAPVAP